MSKLENEYKKAMKIKADLFGSNGTDFDKVDSAIDALIAVTHKTSGWWMCFHHLNGEVFLSSRVDYIDVRSKSARQAAAEIHDLCGVNVSVTRRNNQYVLEY